MLPSLSLSLSLPPAQDNFPPSSCLNKKSASLSLSLSLSLAPSSTAGRGISFLPRTQNSPYHKNPPPSRSVLSTNTRPEQKLEKLQKKEPSQRQEEEEEAAAPNAHGYLRPQHCHSHSLLSQSENRKPSSTISTFKFNTWKDARHF